MTSMRQWEGILLPLHLKSLVYLHPQPTGVVFFKPIPIVFGTITYTISETSDAISNILFQLLNKQSGLEDIFAVLNTHLRVLCNRIFKNRFGFQSFGYYIIICCLDIK